MEEKSNSEAGELTTPRSASSQGEKDKGKKDKHHDKKHKEKKEKEKKEKKDKKSKKDDKPLPDVVPISDAQRTAIGVFKERVKEYIKPHHTDDTFIRFLRARNFDLEKSAEMFINSMKWREEFGADNILDTFRSNPFYDVLNEYWPSATHGLTKDGWPVYFERIGQVDARGLLKAVSEKDLLHYHVFTVERDEKRRAQLFAERGVYPGTVIVQDCQGLGWKHLYRPAIGVLQKLFKMDQDNYPESLRKMYVVNAPKLFTVVYAMVKPLVDPRTLQKVIVLGSSFKEELLKVMDEDQLPKVLGGSCKMHEGECMPKGGKFPDVKRGASTVGDDEDSETFEVTIASQDKHEHEVKIDDDESVLAWQFKTENHNIGFAVFRKVDNNAREAILEHQKYDAHEEVIENSLPVTPGHYILHWDNTFSRFRKKQLTYSVMVTSPKSERKDEPVTDPLANTNAVDSAVVQTEKKD